jgi:glycine dehydrogenase subunit 1
MYRANYAIRLLSKIEGLKVPVFKAPHFKEFTVNFDSTGLKVEEVHEALLNKGVHGGKNVSREFPELGETALYCVTEVHNEAEIRLLAEALDEIFSSARRE